MFRNFGSARARGFVVVLATVTLSLVVAGCSSTDSPAADSGVDSGSTTCDLAGVEALFTAKCAFAGCHDGTATTASGLSLKAGADLATRLLGVMPSSATSQSCGTVNKAYLIAHATPATGLLIDKLTMSSPPCGAQMPYGGVLPAAELACVKSWAATVTAP